MSKDNKNSLGNGTATYSSESGKLEMTGYTSNVSDYDFLHSILKEDFPQYTIEESKDLEGFILREKVESSHQTAWSHFTVYCSNEPRKYSAYETINDTAKGIDIEDERALCIKRPIGEIRDKINETIKKYSNAPSEETFSIPDESIFDDNKLNDASEWVQFTKRTEDPKLSWLEDQLNKAGIAHRRNGESFHAPITEVLKKDIEAANKILAKVDNIRDDAPRFKRWMEEQACKQNEPTYIAYCTKDNKIVGYLSNNKLICKNPKNALNINDCTSGITTVANDLLKGPHPLDHHGPLTIKIVSASELKINQKSTGREL